MSWLTRISIFNRWITILVAIAIVGISIFGTLQLKTEMLPDMELPYLVVYGISQGQSPEDMVDNFGKPIEDEFLEIDGLKHIESTCSENNCSTLATFEYGTDMDKAEEDITQRLKDKPGYDFEQLIENGLDLESETSALIVSRISFEMIPVVWITVSGNSGMTSAEVRSVAEELSDKVSDVEGILAEEDQTPFMKRVDIQGGDEDVLVIPNVAYMNASDIPVSWLIETLNSKAEYASVAEIRSTTLLNDPAANTIGDIATVTDDPVPTSFTNGQPSVSITWTKDPEANTVDVANGIISKIREFEREDLPDEMAITVVMDQSDYIETSINDLAFNAVIGLILAAVAVLLFLWAFRASLIITVSIPFSILIAFLLMYVFDVTINILTLSGLAIAVGRIVDNSIVSLENIYRHMQRKESFMHACVDGIKEVAMPITSATIATVVIFIPLIIVGGLVGELFRPFALTVTFALLASLLVALMLVPPLSSFMGTKKVSFEASDNWYTRFYTRTLRWALGHRAITILLTVAVFIASMFITPLLGTSFLNTGGEKAMTVEIQMPYGDDLDMVQKIKEVEGKIDELDQEEGKIESHYAYFGSLMNSSEQSVATLQVDLTGDADMDQQADVLRSKCEEISGDNTTIKVVAGSMEEQMFGSGGLEIRVIGEEGDGLEPVEQMTEELTELLRELENRGDLENLDSQLVENKSDTAKQWTEAGLVQYAAATGQTSISVVGEQLESEWIAMRFGWPLVEMGQTGPTVGVNSDKVGITVPGVVKALSDLDTIEELRIGSDSPMELSELAVVEMKSAEYNRAEGGYAGTITATITSDDVGSVNDEVQGIIDDMELIDGVKEIEMGGLAEQMMEGFSDMFIAIGVAVLLVLAVLIISFRSWLTPLLIMVSMPLASIGAVLALLITGKTLGMSAMMGILMLVGIVLTNAIVFLTFVDDRRKEGYSAHDALVDAGRIRLRPILMTALTTMIALIPLAVGFGEGMFMAAELGVVVIGGLFSSTLLTLLVVPVLYSLTERFRRQARPSKN